MSGKTPNHHLSAMRCPVDLQDVDLFSAGAQEHWYEAYEILHAEAPVKLHGRLHGLPRAATALPPGRPGVKRDRPGSSELVASSGEPRSTQ